MDARLRRFLGFRLKRVFNLIRADLLEQLVPLGLHITTFSTLVVIVDHPGLRQSALADTLDIKTSNMVAIIDDLEQRGWITRQRVPEDRRAFALFVTESGQRVCEMAVALASEHESKLLTCLSEQELDSLMNMLEKIETMSEYNDAAE